MAKGTATSSTKYRSKLLQSGALLVMMITPIFLYFAAGSASIGWVIFLFIIEAASMATAMVVS